MILQTHAVTHLVLCGRSCQDSHVAATQKAVTGFSTELHIAPLVPADPSDIRGILDEAVAFMQDALQDELNAVLVACSKGASRSVAVVLAYLLSNDLTLETAFELVAGARWRIWPSALLVNSLMSMAASRFKSIRKPELVRRIGAHAAWATAWHNGVGASRAEAEAAWDECSTEGLELEEAFAKCKQKLLGKSSADLDMFCDQPKAPPHAEVSDVGCGLRLCGLGELSPDAIASLLQKHAIARVVVCGKPERDVHVSRLQTALPISGIAASNLHVVPVRDSADEDLTPLLTAAVRFAMSESGTTLIACRQGASRSASVAAACLMTKLNISFLEAFDRLASARWRLWPNSGFVLQLLSFEDSLRQPQGHGRTSQEYKEQVLRKIGIHAAWATNQHNLQSGNGRQGLTLQDVEGFWNDAANMKNEPEELFELCKVLTLGVDLSSFVSFEPSPKRARNEAAAESKRCEACCDRSCTAVPKHHTDLCKLWRT